MEPIAEKRHALDRALEMLSRDNVDDLRYAALELRRCIEAVVYEKLWAYRDRFPPEVARKWQPPQAFRALLVMEPDAEQTAVIRFARQSGPGETASGPVHELGTDQRFSSAWLNKTYNKLGSYVHASWPFAKNPDNKPLATARDFLQRTASDMEPLVRRSFTCTLAEVVDFQCSECGTAIKANVAGVKQEGEVVCLNPDCAPPKKGTDLFILPNPTKYPMIWNTSESSLDIKPSPFPLVSRRTITAMSRLTPSLQLLQLRYHDIRLTSAPAALLSP